MNSKKKAIKESLIAEGGDKFTSGIGLGLSEADTEQMILNYAKTAFAAWKNDPQENSELAEFSLFMLLNDSDSDLMASWDEIQPIQTFVQPKMDEEGKVEYDKEVRMKKAFDDNQNSNFLNFREFQ